MPLVIVNRFTSPADTLKGSTGFDERRGAGGGGHNPILGGGDDTLDGDTWARSATTRPEAATGAT